MPSLTATYARYRPDDGACCPSATSRVEFTLENSGAGWVLTPGEVTTTANQ